MANKKNNLRELSGDELQAQYHTFKDELFNLRFQLATGQLENTARLKTVRRNIARVMTYMHQAELEKSGQKPGYLPPRNRRRRFRRDVRRSHAAPKVKA